MAESEKTLEQCIKFPPVPLGQNQIYDEYMVAHGLAPITTAVDPKGLIGIEVEVENIRKIAPDLSIGFWGIKEDGSLRNDGREFVTPALPSVYAKPALQALFLGLNKNIDFSRRTSIHVHANMRTLVPSQILALLYVYHTIEPLLFKFVGGNRHNNIFCVPWANSGSLELASVKEGFLPRIKNLREQSHKYSALNLVPLTKFGTLEFRHMPGTADVDKIHNWVNIILSMKVYAMKAPIERIIETISALNTNSHYIDFLTTVFGPLYANLDTSEIVKDMEPGVTDIKEVVSKMLYHHKIMTDYIKTGVAETSRAGKLYSKLHEGKPFNNKTPVNVKVMYGIEEGGPEEEVDAEAGRFRRVANRGAGAEKEDGELADFNDYRYKGRVRIHSTNPAGRAVRNRDLEFPERPIPEHPLIRDIAYNRLDNHIWATLAIDNDFGYGYPKLVSDPRGQWIYFDNITRRWCSEYTRIQQYNTRESVWHEYRVAAA